jgi:hypothetical protein
MECRGWRERARRAEAARLPRPAIRPRVAEATLTVPLLLAVRVRGRACRCGICAGFDDRQPIHDTTVVISVSPGGGFSR